MTPLKLVALDDVVVFPGMPVTLSEDVGADTRVLLVPRRGAGFAKVGVVAEVSERVALANPRLPRSTAACPVRRAHRPGLQLRVEVDEASGHHATGDLTRGPSANTARWWRNSRLRGDVADQCLVRSIAQPAPWRTPPATRPI
jgi:hypothetical protein